MQSPGSDGSVLHLQPVQFGQHEIENNQIGMFGLPPAEAFRAGHG